MRASQPRADLSRLRWARRPGGAPPSKTGGFGCILLLAHHRAEWEATRRSQELFVRHVLPRFEERSACGSLSMDWDARQSRMPLATDARPPQRVRSSGTLPPRSREEGAPSRGIAVGKAGRFRAGPVLPAWTCRPGGRAPACAALRRGPQPRQGYSYRCLAASLIAVANAAADREYPRSALHLPSEQSIMPTPVQRLKSTLCGHSHRSSAPTNPLRSRSARYVRNS